MKKINFIGAISSVHQKILATVFEKHEYHAEFNNTFHLSDGKNISLTQEASFDLENKKIKFFNWDLLFSVLGPKDQTNDLEGKIVERINVLKSIENLSIPKAELEFHGSIRVSSLGASARFYSWLFGVEPKEWTHRYVTFQRLDTRFNFVLLVADGKELNKDTLYHLGIGVESKDKVIEYFHSALENGFHIEKPPRTTWRGTPLHELWLKDPDGTLIEVYSRLTDDELRQMPSDKEAFNLV